jgi:hypothetical protein
MIVVGNENDATTPDPSWPVSFRPSIDLPETVRHGIAHDFITERYKFVLQQIHVINENLYRFLAIYQTVATALIGAQLLLMANYRQWKIRPHTAHLALIGLSSVQSIIGLFILLLIVVGILAWFDYRSEECDLSEWIIGPGFRDRPKKGNWYRWYETYIGIFVVGFILLGWMLTFTVMIPAVS